MSKPTIAFFGATGGCGLSTLYRAIAAGYSCTALVRDSSKLTKLLIEKSITEEQIKSYLTIVEGNATKDQEAVEKALIAPSTGKLVDIVISSLGAAPHLQASITQPVTLDQPGLCANATRIQLQSLEKLQASSQGGSQSKPLFLIVSTTGIDKERRDVPYAMVPMYHWLLAVPHEDKIKMEDMLDEAAGKANSPIRGAIAVRPSLLMDGEGKGIDYIRFGDSHHPALGYTIPREDVGCWIFEKVIKNGARDEFAGKKISITSSKHVVDGQGH